MIICLEGVDNTGKTTLINHCINNLKTKKSIFVLHANDFLNFNKEISKEYANLFETLKKDDADDKYLRTHLIIHEYCKKIEHQYDYIILDRGLLSYFVYNAPKKKQLVLLASKFYCNMILYFQGKVILKKDELLSQAQMEIYNSRYLDLWPNFTFFNVENERGQMYNYFERLLCEKCY